MGGLEAQAMTDLAALLARVEGASGPDREIDAEVCLAFGAAVEEPQRNRFGEIIVPAWWTMPGASRAIWPHRTTPWFVTASIDVTVRLAEKVLPGWAWSVGNRTVGGQAYVMKRGEGLIEGKAPTPALALVAAIIRAKMGEAG